MFIFSLHGLFRPCICFLFIPFPISLSFIKSRSLFAESQLAETQNAIRRADAEREQAVARLKVTEEEKYDSSLIDYLRIRIQNLDRELHDLRVQLKEERAAVSLSIGTSLSRSPVERTASLRGGQISDSLNKVDDSRTRIFVSEDGQPAIAARGVLKEFDGSTGERDLVAHLWPYFQRIFPERTLVNSEQFRWLVMDPKKPQNNQKPDLFWCHPACYSSKQAPRSDQTGRVFGVPSDMCLLEDIFIGDCKCDLNTASIGEVVTHLHQIALHISDTLYGMDNPTAPIQQARGMLFDWEKCWLLEVNTHGSVMSRVIVRFDQARFSATHSLNLFLLTIGGFEAEPCLSCSPAPCDAFATSSASSACLCARCVRAARR